MNFKNLFCAGNCNQPIGNTFCDDGNNNVACQFDGGDCYNQQGAGGIPWDNWCEVSDL